MVEDYLKTDNFYKDIQKLSIAIPKKFQKIPDNPINSVLKGYRKHRQSAMWQQKLWCLNINLFTLSIFFLVFFISSYVPM